MIDPGGCTTKLSGAISCLYQQMKTTNTLSVWTQLALRDLLVGLWEDSSYQLVPTGWVDR